MELAAGIIVGAILVIAGLKLKNKIESLEKEIYNLQKQRHTDNMEMENMAIDMSILKVSIPDNHKLENKMKMLEEELKFEKKSNGMNFQKMFKDIIKLREHLTYIQNK